MALKMHSLLSILSEIQRTPSKILFKENTRERTASQFLLDIQNLSAQLAGSKHKRFALCYKNGYAFTVALFAILCNKHHPILLPNNQSGTIKLFTKECDSILSDSQTIEKHASPINKTQKTKSPLNLELNESQLITLFTSGSTGAPKKVSRSLKHLMNEISALEFAFGRKMKKSFVYSTASHQHIYGLLFHILWPLCAERIIHFPTLTHPESIEAILASGHPVTLVSNPSLLDRIPCKTIKADHLTLFSSGGLLKRSTALKIHQSMRISAIEVLGSTETGGVGFRKQNQNSAHTNWTPFQPVKIKIDPLAQRLIVESPFFENTNGFTMGDKVKIDKDNTFQLLERADRIVKIEGKKASLPEIEAILKSHKLVKDAYTLPMESNRQYIAVAVVLTPEGKSILNDKGKLFLNSILKETLLQYFEHALLPKQFRYLDSIPTNEQGKHLLHDIKKLFEKQPSRYPKFINHGKSSEKHKIILELYIPKELIFFNGHFPHAPILPGVVMVDWAISFANQFFDIPKENFLRLDQLKFSKIIPPQTTLNLVLQIKNGTLIFKYFNDEVNYSSGKIKIEEKET